MKDVVVFGSFNADLMARTPHLPSPGESVIGTMFKIGPGGKGSNQAIASAMAGADTAFICKLGKDDFGRMAVDAYKRAGVDISHIFYHDTEPTGVALISVEEATAENHIIVVPGSSMTITKEEIHSCEDMIMGAKAVLLQLEVSYEANLAVAKMAHESNALLILNTAPMNKGVPDELLSLADFVTPNETEAGMLSGIPIHTPEDASKAADAILAKGVKNVIITLGSHGVYFKNAREEYRVPAMKVDAVDTTGAGDAFHGGFAAALSWGKSVKEAMIYGTAVAALSVTKVGAAAAMPTKAETEAFLASRK